MIQIIKIRMIQIKNIKGDPDDNFDNMDLPAVNFLVTQPALHYALSWWKFWLFERLMHHITNNHKSLTNQSYQSTRIQTYELSRPAGSGRASNQPIISQSIIQSIKQRTNQTTKKSNNQQIKQPRNQTTKKSNNQEIKQPINQKTNKSTNPIYLNTDIWTGQVCREGLDKTMAHRSRRCSRLTRHSTWVSIIIMWK